MIKSRRVLINGLYGIICQRHVNQVRRGRKLIHERIEKGDVTGQNDK